MNFTAIFALFAAFSVAFALPSKRGALDVFVPTITFPTSQAILTVGNTYNVTWVTSNAPANITNKIGVIFLKQGSIFPLVLAGNFPILSGSVQFTVPWVLNGSYNIVLFGDSGNDSPAFNITGPNPYAP